MNNIGLVVKGKQTVGNFVVVHLGRVSSTMPPLQTNELERIAHALRKTAYGQPAKAGERKGFPYTLPFNLGD